ncbi:helix-turn-helix domain-containing protein [Streptomyces radicis]|uniref:DNA-binding protein n=1 Tax=Streptomyces radicis TaxID=1750517 RepID=A0A3A9WGW7_9ACTN|nr:helix-turn-helix domain-containing protein [Streptomyces radicis]RKN11553.1 DNA-binding protein [Streptomyces radicis]RKN26429.1 DNA-binding protein [Streptomyces radicis]
MSGGRAPRRTLPTELAALAVGVSEATIRKWASRGKITRYGSARRARYDLDELVAIAVSRGGTTRG